MLEILLAKFVHVAVTAIELVGVAIISVGALATLVQFLWTATRRTGLEAAVDRLRSDMGRVILIGLELLVAADIIHTVLVDMTIESIAALAGIVLIRTVLSFSLETEIEGRWPWQRGKSRLPKESTDLGPAGG